MFIGFRCLGCLGFRVFIGFRCLGCLGFRAMVFIGFMVFRVFRV